MTRLFYSRMWTQLTQFNYAVDIKRKRKFPMNIAIVIGKILSLVERTKDPRVRGMDRRLAR